MVVYKCDKCFKEFKQKGHYKRHLQRKYSCKKIENNDKIYSNNGITIPKMEYNIKCDFCFNIYSTKFNLNKHLKICKLKSEDDKKQKLYELLIKDQNRKLEEQNLYLQQQISLLQEQLKLSRNNNINKNSFNNNNNNINSNNTINILAYNKTDISHITDKDFEYIMNRCNMCVPRLIEKTHYDPKKPENKNIYISNIKDKYIMTWNGIKWNLKNREETLDDIYENSSNILEDKIETWESNKFQYDPVAVSKFYKFLDNKEKDEVKNKIKDEIKLILYNNREVEK